MHVAGSMGTRIAVDEVRMISLPERADRVRKFSTRLGATTLWPFPTPVVSDGIRETAPPWYQSSNGAWGCRQAHLRILREQWSQGTESTLVLEDDAVWTPSSLGDRWNLISMNIPEDWDMIMLGGEHLAPPVIIGPHVVRCVNTRRTHAYLVRLKAIPLLIRTWQQARRHIDHSNSIFQAQARVYATDPFLFGQDAGRSDISGNHNDDIRYWA